MDDQDPKTDITQTSEAGGKKSTRHMGLAIWNMRGERQLRKAARDQSETEAR